MLRQHAVAQRVEGGLGVGVGFLGAGAIAHAIEKMRLGLLDPRDIEIQIGPLPEPAGP